MIVIWTSLLADPAKMQNPGGLPGGSSALSTGQSHVSERRPFHQVESEVEAMTKHGFAYFRV
jgi:hypothetical protein